jgi:hypothetical protein
MCLKELFVEFVPVPPEHEKYCFDVSCPGRTGINYVTRRFHRKQKHKFAVTCPDVLFYGIRTSPTQERKIMHRCFVPRTQ